MTVDHLLLPLDDTHEEAIGRVVDGLAEVVGTDLRSAWCPHLTLVSYARLPPDEAAGAIAWVAAATAPPSLHAHGYGFFAGHDPVELSLHVPVVRTRALDDLHRSLFDALIEAGAEVAGWCTPDVWSPHLTLVDRSLTPESLGAAVSWLARRPHPSWRLTADAVAVSAGWRERDRPMVRLPLAGSTSAA